MLYIDKDILMRVSDAFRESPVEQGFLLGSGQDFDHIDYCFNLPAFDAGIHFYEPNPIEADNAIKCWGQMGVCFSGMIHSHVVNKMDLSENDIEFAKALYSAYHLPELWFGIGIVHIGNVVFRFYSVSKTDEQVNISPETYIITNKEH